jgi:hypothetical protein
MILSLNIAYTTNNKIAITSENANQPIIVALVSPKLDFEGDVTGGIIISYEPSGLHKNFVLTGYLFVP